MPSMADALDSSVRLTIDALIHEHARLADLYWHCHDASWRFAQRRLTTIFAVL